MADLSFVPALVWVIASASPGGDVTPIDSATTSLVTYITSFGAVGIIAVAFAFGYIKPSSAVKEAREQARADLLKENERLAAEKDALKAELTEEQRFTRTEVVPLLAQFTSVTSGLVPVLQGLIPLLQAMLVQRREDRDDRGPERQR